MNAEKIQQATNRAIQLLKELEQALDVGDHRKVGARLAELRWALKAIQDFVNERTLK